MTPGKSIALIQPSLLPSLDYFQLIHAVDCFYLLDSEPMPTQFRIRLLEQGEPCIMTLPFESVRERLHQAYCRAPFYSELASWLDDWCQFDNKSLIELIEQSLLWICRYLRIDTPILRTSDLQPTRLEGQDHIIALCHQMNAQQFLSLPTVPVLFEESRFQREKIQLFFLLSQQKKYPQFCADFHGNLSILDLLMHVSRFELQKYLVSYRVAMPVLQHG